MGSGRSCPSTSAYSELALAVLARGIVLNVLREEQPEARESRFQPFLAGAGGYSLLQVAM